MSDIKVYDNFLDYKDYHPLKDIFCCTDSSKGASFFYSPTILSDSKLNHGYDFQFTHGLYDGVLRGELGILSPHFDLLNPIFKKLKVEKLYKAKVNIRTRSPKIYQSGFHVDIRTSVSESFEGYKTAIYYINTNDGYTLFESGEKVKSVSNRIVIFDGQLFHCGTTCTDQNIRSVLNINYS